MSHDREENSICDGEDAVIMTARRVRIVRCCQAKQTTLSSVRIRFAMSHGTQLIVTRASRREDQKMNDLNYLSGDQVILGPGGMGRDSRSFEQRRIDETKGNREIHLV